MKQLPIRPYFTPGPYPLNPLHFRSCRSSGVLGRSNSHPLPHVFLFPEAPQGVEYMKNDRTKTKKRRYRAAERGSRQQREKYRLILDSISDAVYKINPEGFFTYLMIPP
jgi:PAS domain-containing protein